MIHITIPGEPVAQGRPRFSSANGFFRAYDPPKSREYKHYVKTIALTQNFKPIDGPVVMEVFVYRGTPKAWSSKKRLEAEKGLHKPALKPDADNYVKSIKDALNGIAYHDDGQVVVLHISKHYSIQPRVEVIVCGEAEWLDWKSRKESGE